MNNSSDFYKEKQRIIDTITQMVTAADRKDWQGCLMAFTPEVLLDHDSGSGHPENVKSSDMITGWEKTFAGFDSTWHSVTNYQIEINENHAVCKSYIHAIHCNFMVKRGANYYTEYGIYEHELVKMEKGWKISVIRYRMLNSEGNPSLFPH